MRKIGDELECIGAERGNAAPIRKRRAAAVARTDAREHERCQSEYEHECVTRDAHASSLTPRRRSRRRVRIRRRL